MIKLDIPYTTTVQYLSGTTVVSSTLTDTLYVRTVTLDFSTGSMYATIARGTTNPTTGVFESNYPELSIVVNPDGTFSTPDGITWSGQVASAPQLVAQLATTFDQFVAASGSVTGKVLSDTPTPAGA